MKQKCEKFKALLGHRKKDIFTESVVSLMVLDGTCGNNNLLVTMVYAQDD